MNQTLRQTIAARCHEFRKDFGPELVAGIVDVFIPDTRSRLVRLENSLALRDVALVRREAHGLKGSCYNVGAERLGDICQELELLAPQARWDLCNSLYRELAEGFEATQSYLEAEKNVTL